MAFNEQRAIEKMMKFMEKYGTTPQLEIPRGNAKLSHGVVLQQAYIDEISKPFAYEIDKESIKLCSKVMSSNLYKTNQLPIVHNLIKTVIYTMVNEGLPRNKLKAWDFSYHSFPYKGRHALANPSTIGVDLASSDHQNNYGFNTAWTANKVYLTVPSPHTFGKFENFRSTIERNILNYDVIRLAMQDNIPKDQLETLHNILHNNRFAGMITDHTYALLRLILA